MRIRGANEDIVILIDAYLSNEDRTNTCRNLIEQIRTVYPLYKIALLNKYPNAQNLDSLVDYYFYYGDGKLLGPPPEHLVKSRLYNRTFIYFDTAIGMCQNWFPIVGATDHAASVFNGYILGSNFAKILGFKKVFHIEYDTDFDLQELKNLEQDLTNFKDYFLLGKRVEHNINYITDAHAIGYSVDFFKGFNLITEDEEWWKLCEKINYFGKNIEYTLPAIIEYQKKIYDIDGIEYPGHYNFNFPNTKWDTINGKGYWTEKWKNIPKLCSGYKNDELIKNQVTLFFFNDKSTPLEVSCKIENQEGVIIYEKHLILNHNNWLVETLNIEGMITVESYNKQEDIETKNTYTFDLKNIGESVYTKDTLSKPVFRFMYK